MEATQAAADILRDGGNAIDAAISAVFTSMTSEFALTGAAGGGAMMIKTPNSMPILYDFFVDTPTYSSKKELDFFRAKVDFGNSTQYFHIGKGSVAIPGNLAGLFTAHQKFGKLPLSVILEPGIDGSRSHGGVVGSFLIGEFPAKAFQDRGGLLVVGQIGPLMGVCDMVVEFLRAILETKVAVAVRAQRVVPPRVGG